jgi:hypothetical protein
MAVKRVLIMANKWWEADPLCGVLIHDRARPAALTNFRYLRYPAPRPVKPKPTDPRPPDPKPEPRLVFDCAGAASVELWCLEELMNPAENSSSTLEKARVLAGAISYGGAAAPDLFIAFGTAGSREGVQVNGSVVIGRRVFIHDPRAHVHDRTGMWTPPQPDQLIDSAYPAQLLARLDEQARYSAEARLLKCPVSPADPPLTFVGNGFASLGVVNITNYDEYVWADGEAIATFQAAMAAAFKTASPVAQVGSVETTHGVIRSASESPFLFVSGITDTEGLFDFQVTPRVYAQNFVAAHNAGVALAWLLPGIVTTL